MTRTWATFCAVSERWHSTNRASQTSRVDGVTQYPTQEGDGAPQLVFFDTDQVLPCYLVDQRNHTRAHAALERAVKVVAEKTGNARPSDGIPKNRSGRRAMPAPGAYAAGAGAPVAPGGAVPPTGGVMPPGLAAYISMITGGGGGYGGGPPPGYGPPPGFFGGGGYGGADY